MAAKKLLTAQRPALALSAALALGALALGGCGAVKVQPTTPAGSTKLVSRGRVDSPLTDIRNHLGCLRDAHLPVAVVSPIKLQIGPLPSGPTIVFKATPGAAQTDQIEATAPGAEVIGPALVYPNQGSGAQLTAIEDCLAQGVQG